MNRRKPSTKRFRSFWQFFSAFLFLSGPLIGLSVLAEPSFGPVAKLIFLILGFACTLGAVRACWMHCRVEGSILIHVGFWSTRRVHALEVVPETGEQKLLFTTWVPVVKTIDKDEIELGFLSGYSFMQEQPNRRVERICDELNILLAQ